MSSQEIWGIKIKKNRERENFRGATTGFGVGRIFPENEELYFQETHECKIPGIGKLTKNVNNPSN